MKAFIFPGQASQYVGMGKELFERSEEAKQLFREANEVLSFPITEVMFNGTADQLKETKITQPSVFLHSVISAKISGASFTPDVVAGHSLGEFSALVAAGAIQFADGLILVKERAEAMQAACEMNPGTMAAVVGMEDQTIEAICKEIEELVVPANYNCPGQLVISGTKKGIEVAMKLLNEKGARMVIPIAVGGAFHSALMEPARERLATVIENTDFVTPSCPVYQNVDGKAHSDPSKIKENLIKQLTSPVKWTTTMQNMLLDGVSEFVEVGGNGKVLSGFIKRIDRKLPCSPL